LAQQISSAHLAVLSPHSRATTKQAMTERDNEQWNKQYAQLVEFKRKHGHCIVPTKYEDDASLGKWVSWQRQSHSKNTIRLDRMKLLDEIGFVWRVDKTVSREDPKWNKQFEKLVEFKQKNGHCLVPKKYEEDSFLGVWVSSQRTRHAQNKLQLDRKGLLDEIGFVWKALVGGAANNNKNNDKNWYQQYEKLVEFKQKNGDCLVPQQYQKDRSLGIWVSNQRTAHANKKMRQDRKDLLNKLGFVSRVRAAPSWHQQYKKLVKFKRKNGNCLVPRGYKQDASLGEWVAYQRQSHANEKLRLDRKAFLDKIGFVWRVENDAQWKKQYEKLVELKQKNGNCLVPFTYKEDVSLGVWVTTQQQLHSKKTIRLDREVLLDEIDFVWKADTLAAAARSSTTHVSCRHWIIISRFIQKICLTLVLVLLLGIGVGFRSDHHQCGTSKRNTRRNGAKTRSRR
jgi:hypothetical protein